MTQQNRQTKVFRSAASGKFVTTVYPKHSIRSSNDGKSGDVQTSKRTK